jgi:4-amino-4-deoxy-L-arabinose transferase-like glycosyltransferase
MNATSQTTSPLIQTVKRTPPRTSRVRADVQHAHRPRLLSPHRLALAAILGLSAAFNTYDLSRNGWANNFYSAGVKSMLLSLHNFIYISFDPGGMITLDKPPLAVWVQAASAKVFGFTPLALLLPEALAGVLCVGALYLAMVKPFGRLAALAGALCLAVFPAFVAVSRDNNPDALLILLMTVSCWIAIKAIDSGRLVTLIACAICVALAFNTKALAAYLVVPGIALGYLLCAQGSLRARVGKLFIAGVVMTVVSIAWLSFVDLTPASHRPYVGGTLDNSELGLTFGYNGFGRIGGQTGGPGSIPNRPGAYAPLPPKLAHAQAIAIHHETVELTQRVFEPVRQAASQMPYVMPTIEEIIGPPGHRHPPPAPEYLPDGRSTKPTPFGKQPGPLRLLEEALGGQAGWLLPLSLGGLIALCALLWTSRRRTLPASSRLGPASPRPGPTSSSPAPSQPRPASPLPAPSQPGPASSQPAPASPQPAPASPQPAPASSQPRLGRRDPRLAGLCVLGGWFLVEAALLSLAKGIVHPYYTSALAPGASAMVGAGLVSFVALIERDRRWGALLWATIVATVATEIALLDRSEYMQWLLPILISAGLLGTAIALLSRRWAAASLAVVGAALLAAPTGFAAATWGAPVEGTFPVAGPWGAPGPGGVGVPPNELPAYRHLVAYLRTHDASRRFSVFTVSSVTAAPLILMGSKAAALGGYSGTDRALSAGGLAHLVERGQARYVLLGGPYSSRGGNGATLGTLKACRQIPASRWGGGGGGGDAGQTMKYSLALFDCRGHAAQLWAAQDG